MDAVTPGPAGKVTKSVALSCPSCGAPIEIRGYFHTVNIVCGHCGVVLDTRTPTLVILQKFETQASIKPAIPLGSRGKLNGVLFEAIGYQLRQIVSDGVAYQWSEYLLFNPFQGYRYLTEYHGHWNFGRTLNALPAVHVLVRPTARLGTQAYRHFQTASAQTVYVLGEFPWQVRVGDQVTVSDYVAPPLLLSSEVTRDEVVWSTAVYTDGRAIWQAFQLPGSPPHPYGVYENQPSPYTGKVGSVWRTFFLLLLVLMASAIVLPLIINRNEKVFDRDYVYDKNPTAEPSFVTQPFTLDGRTSAVEIRTNTNIDDDWVYFHYALINEETGHAFDFGREISKYSDEGSKNDSVTIPSVPSGKYYLRVEPEMDPNSPTLRYNRNLRYEIIIRRDPPHYWFFVVVFFLLLVPPIYVTIQATKFESARWADSDYGSGGGI